MRHIRNLWMGFFVLLSLLVLGACQSQETEDQSEEVMTETVQLTGSDGDTVSVPRDSKKLVVFDYGALDVLQYIGAQEAVIGVAGQNLPDYLKEYEDKASVGTVKEPNLEAIHALKPDLIVISGRQLDFKEELSKIAPTLYLTTDPEDYFASAEENAVQLASIYGKTEVVHDAFAGIDQQRDTLVSEVEKHNWNALFVMLNEGQLSAYGPGSRFGMIYDGFGFKPADKELDDATHGQSISYEYLLEVNPDVLFVLDRSKAIGGDESDHQLLENDVVRKTKASEEGRIITVQSNIWYLATGGIHATEEMIQDVSAVIAQ